MAFLNPVNKSYCLQQLCESNYQKLLRLIPNLHSINQSAIGYSFDKPALELEILDKAPYTLTLLLSHDFNKNLADFIEPALKVRVYLDMGLVEVIRDKERVEVNIAIKDFSQGQQIMDYKWTLNYFLEKWLEHCLQINYIFKEFNIYSKSA